MKDKNWTPGRRAIVKGLDFDLDPQVVGLMNLHRLICGNGRQAGEGARDPGTLGYRQTRLDRRCFVRPHHWLSALQRCVVLDHRPGQVKQP